MTTKSKPRLHLVRGDQDPELYCADLDWYYGQYDSECGLKSIGVANVLDAAISMGSYTAVDEIDAIPIKVTVTRNLQRWFEGGPWDDHHAQFRGRGEYCAFTRGRRVWRRLQRLPWVFQETLRLHYEARQLYVRDEEYWHDEAVTERFDVSASDLPMPKRRPSTVRKERVEVLPPSEVMVRAAHREFLSIKEAA
jgi:hypothetical protein